MDIGNENDPEFRLEQILEKKVEVVLLCCSIGAIPIYYIVLLVLRLVVVLLLRKNQKKKILMSVPYHIEKVVLRFMQNRLLDLNINNLFQSENHRKDFCARKYATFAGPCTPGVRIGFYIVYQQSRTSSK